MFLTMLSTNEQKNFLELAYIAMNVDGSIDDREKNIIDVYRKETGLLDYVIQKKKLQELINAFQASTKKVRKAALVELAGVLDADENIDSVEADWIHSIGHEWGLRDTEIKRLVRWTQDFNDLLAEGYGYILNKR